MKDFLKDNDRVSIYKLDASHVPIISELLDKLKTTNKPVFFIEPKIGRDNQKLYDWIEFFHVDAIDSLKNNNGWLIYNWRNEGYPGDYLPDFTTFAEIYHNLEKHNISPSNFIFITSNLKGHIDMKKYADKHNKGYFHVLAYPFFETATKANFVSKVGYCDDQSHLKRIKKQGRRHIGDKIFMSLSRVNRFERSLGTFMLETSTLSNFASVSHDSLSKKEVDFYIDWYRRVFEYKFDIDDFKNWAKQPARYIDRSDFDKNWADWDVSWVELFNLVPFHLTNETWARDWDQQSMFLSEKTFKPFLSGHPNLVNGQCGCNAAIKDLGYQLFDDDFDFSFDEILDFEDRYAALLESIRPTVMKLANMTKSERIEWRFSRWKKIKHNFLHTMALGGSHKKYNEFLQRLDKFLIDGIVV